jgi:type 1 glutamine amidotransferase
MNLPLRSRQRRIGPLLFALTATLYGCVATTITNEPDVRGTNGSPAPARKLRILFFTKEAFPDAKHTAAHAIGDRSVPAYLRDRGHTVFVTADSAVFNPTSLQNYDLALFFVTNGLVFDAEQRVAFEGFIRSRKGFAGVHWASYTEYDWPFFNELVGAVFAGHGTEGLKEADLYTMNPDDPIVAFLPSPWRRKDEWYFFRTNPKDNPNLQLLLRIDEVSMNDATYPVAGLTGIHPLAWRHEFHGARSFYTALGHSGESYQEPLFLKSIALGVEWAGAGAP